MPPAAIAVATVATTAVSAFSQYQAGKSQAKAINYNAQNNNTVANYNAQSVENIGEYNAQQAESDALIYEQAAEDAIKRGAENSSQERIAAKKANATGRAVVGSSGLAADTGNALDIQGQNAARGEMNALTVMNDAEREAYGYKLQATSERQKAQNYRYTSKVDASNTRLGAQVGLANAKYEAKNAKYAGRLNAGTTLITGAVNAGSAFSGLKVR